MLDGWAIKKLGETYVALLQAHGQTTTLNHHRDGWLLDVVRLDPLDCRSSDFQEECDCGAGKLGSIGSD